MYDLIVDDDGRGWARPTFGRAACTVMAGNGLWGSAATGKPRGGSKTGRAGVR